MSFSSLLIHSALIERVSAGAKDSGNLDTETWATLASLVPCRVDSDGGKEVYREAQLVLSTHRIFMADRDVTEKDRITVNSQVFDVLVKESKLGAAGVHHLELVAREVRV